MPSTAPFIIFLENGQLLDINDPDEVEGQLTELVRDEELLAFYFELEYWWGIEGQYIDSLAEEGRQTKHFFQGLGFRRKRRKKYHQWLY